MMRKGEKVEAEEEMKEGLPELENVDPVVVMSSPQAKVSGDTSGSDMLMCIQLVSWVHHCVHAGRQAGKIYTCLFDSLF